MTDIQAFAFGMVLGVVIGLVTAYVIIPIASDAWVKYVRGSAHGRR